MKNKITFYIIDILLVLLVGLIIGLTFSDYIFSGTVGIVAFICLLVALSLPRLMLTFNTKLITGSRFALSFFIVGEIILNIVYLFFPKSEIKIYAIIQLLFVVALLVSLLIILGLFKNDDAKEDK